MKNRLCIGLLLCVFLSLLFSMEFQSDMENNVVKIFVEGDKTLPAMKFHNADKSLFLKPKMQRQHILLVAYLRTGSTFTGSMFDTHRDIFYSFEPLRPIQMALEDNRTMFYLNGTKTYKNDDLLIRETIKNVLRCKLSQLSTNVLRGSFWKNSKASKSYWKCIKTSDERLRGCVKALEKTCLQKNVTVIKTIRLHMEDAQEMLHKESNLKVIHLVRDPRPTLYSAKKWGYVKPGSLEEHASSYCSRMYNDALVTKKLLNTHKGEVKLVFYEDIVNDTKGVVQDMYDFVGKPFTSEVDEHIKDLGRSTDLCFLCLERANATHQLMKWRMEMPYKDVKIIDSQCGLLYGALGYKAAKTENLLRNLNHELRESIVSLK